MKSKLFSRKNLWFYILFAVLDLIAVGAGMGVPIFAILLGFAIGWVAPIVYKELLPETLSILRRSLVVALLYSALTMILMLAIWSPSLAKLWDPTFDVANYGIPMILYEPRASFIGWMVLMILISPVLQFLVIVSVAALRIAWFPPKKLEMKKEEI